MEGQREEREREEKQAMANHSNQGLGIGPSRIGQGMVGLGLCNKCLT